MPRNPHKTRCAVVGCRAWSMRDSLYCRAHRSPQLGSCGGGAPQGNLNAFVTGRHVHLLPSSEVDRAAREIVERPDGLPEYLDLTVSAICARTADPYCALSTLRSLLTKLIDALATRCVEDEVEGYLALLPESARAYARTLLDGQLSPLPPERRMHVFRRFLSRRRKQGGAPPSDQPQ